MKTFLLAAAGLCLAVLGQTPVLADVSTDFSGSNNSAWRPVFGPLAAWSILSAGPGNSFGEYTITPSEYNPFQPMEAMALSVNPVNTGAGTTWSASMTVNGATTPQNVMSSKELLIGTGSLTPISYDFGLLSGASARSSSATAVTGYELEILKNASGQFMYFNANGMIYSGGNTLQVQSTVNGDLDFYLDNAIVGSELVYSLPGANLANPNFNDLTSIGVGGFNFGSSSYNGFIQNASGLTFAAAPEPSTYMYMGTGLASILLCLKRRI